MALIIRNPTVDLPRLLSSCKKNKNNNIQKVVLDRCLITPDHALLLKEALLQTTTLTVLYLFGTTWASPKAFHEMTRGLAGNTTLQILYLCGDTSLTMSVLGPALADNTSIQELYLWDNQLTDDDAVILAATVLGSASYCCTESDDEGPNTTKSATNVNNNKLMKLHVPRNNIGSRGANALIAAAAAHPTLQELHLSHNTLVHLSDTSLPQGKISETTTASNATSNQQNQLHALHLDGNPMLDIAQVARVLSKNPRVRHLNLGNCLVEVKGCLALASAMRTNTNLQTLSIRKALVSNRNNEIPSSQEQQDTVEAAFVSVLRHDNRTLLELDIATTAVPAILHYLEFNKTGRHLLAQDDLLLWPLVLQKVAHKPALLHEFISAKPEWFQR